MDDSKMLASHLEKKTDVTVGVAGMPIENACQSGVLQVDKRGSIVEFHEKPESPGLVPDKPGTIYASMGIYVFNREVLRRELIRQAEHNSRRYFGKDILPKILGKKRIFPYGFVDENRTAQPYWRDTGTLDAF